MASGQVESSTTLYSSILLLGAAHGVFLALALINVRSGNTVALRLLAMLTVTFAVDLGVDFLNVSGYLYRFPRVVLVESVTSFLYGPLTYLYVLALTSRNRWHMSPGQWLHFLPFVISIVLLVPFYGMSDQALVDMIYADASVDQYIGLWVLGGLVVELMPIPLIGVYLALSIRRLAHHGRAIREQFSSIERISLNWLRNLLFALGLLYVLYFVALLGGGERPLENVLNIATVIVIYTIGYLGLRQPIIFQQPDSAEAVAEQPKYRKSALDDESSELLLQELRRVMATDRPYLDSKLSLGQLASQIGISSNYLSQIINQQTGSNFFDYINSHRVDAAKEILADPDRAKSNILTIAMDSGFNSKSAFYTAFKQHANVTPSEYRREKVS